MTRQHTHITLLQELGVQFDPNLARAKVSAKRSRLPYPRKPSPILKAATEEVMHGEAEIIEGDRNNALTRIAGGMRRQNRSEGEILRHLLALNETRVQPPLAENEVRTIATGMMRYEPAPLHSPVVSSLNDAGNAARLVAKFEGRIRHLRAHNEWIVWTDADRWEHDHRGSIVEMAKHTGKGMFFEMVEHYDPAVATAMALHARRSLDVARIKAMVELAKTDPSVVTRPEQLDQRPDLLGVANGVIDLNSGVLIANEPSLLITRHSPVRHDPAATCPIFSQFLNVAMAGDAHLVAYLQRMVGYALSGYANEQVIFFLYGSGANGKSTFMNVIDELLGSELCRPFPYDSLVVKKQGRTATNDLARLDGIRVALTSEVEAGSRLAESFIKQITGGERIAARFLYAEFFDFLPQFKLVMAGNYRPVIHGDDLGIWRRIHLVPFNVTIREADRDPKLMEKLRAELPGILNWALAGHREWRAKSLKPPSIVVDAVETYRKEMDLFGRWLQECCEVVPIARGQASQLYASYTTWAQANGLRPMSMPGFATKLAERFERRKDRKGNFYEGVAIQRPK